MNAAPWFDTQRPLDERHGLKYPWLWIISALLTGFFSGAWLQAERDRRSSVIADPVTFERLDALATADLAANPPRLNQPNTDMRQNPPVYPPGLPRTADEFFLALSKQPK